MKNYLSSLIPAMLLLMITSGNLVAQNTGAKTNKMLVDTTYVRAIEVMLMPGQKTDTHTHPAHFYYALTDGKLKVHYTDGKSEEFMLKAGDCGYSEPERPHMTENTGDKPIRFMYVELKEHPYKATAKTGTK